METKYLQMNKTAEGYEYVTRKIGSDGAVVVIPYKHIMRYKNFFDGVKEVLAFQLILSKRPTFKKRILEFPAGLLDMDGRSIQDTVISELKEETGWNGVIDMETTFDGMPTPSSSGLTDECLYIYPTRLTSKGETDLGEGEDIEVLPLMDATEIKNYVKEHKDEILVSSRVMAFFMRDEIESPRYNKMFVGIDMQNDFMNKDGALYVPGAEDIKEDIVNFFHKVREYKGNKVVFSADEHSIYHPEISETPDFKTTFPPHCLKDTEGQKLISGLNDEQDWVFNKIVFDVWDGMEFYEFMHHEGFSKTNSYSSVVVCGVAGDVCVKYFVDGMIRNSVGWCNNIVIVTDLIKSINEDYWETLLAYYDTLPYVTLMTSKEVLERLESGKELRR